MQIVKNYISQFSRKFVNTSSNGLCILDSSNSISVFLGKIFFYTYPILEMEGHEV